ncbi:MAG: NADH-quinone oxidoreductase subunit M [Gammaproteobacteria bacterium]|nr:NADH-quinone oxidoreductase subunit M [Gammaproteobacteria bacterium]
MDMTSHFSLLSLLIFSPLLGVALLWLSNNKRHIQRLALLGSLLSLIVSLVLLARFDPAYDGFQFIEKMPWIHTLNIQYFLGIDGLSILFLPLTSLLFCAVIIASWNTVRSMPHLYYSMLLLLQTATLGIFTSLDSMLFFLFWELSLVPIYFLISLWGVGPNRRYAAVKYTLFMLAGGVPLLFGFIVLAFNQANGVIPAGLSFDYQVLLAGTIPIEAQTTVFFLLLLGFGAKAPIFPFHTWLPTVAMEGPVAIAAIMTGLKLGVYGFIRFVIPLAPQAALDYHWLLAGLGVVSIIYGAIIALNQSNLRAVLAYASISHVGLVLLGIASFNIMGIQGALFQLLNFSIVAGGIFLITGFLHHRTGSTDNISLGGVASSMPLLASFFLLFGLAGLGLPGTNGFAAEHLILLSSLQTHTGAGIAALAGLILSAAYFMGIYRTAFLGRARHSVVIDAVDLLPRELALVLVFSILILFMGIFPNTVLDITRSASELWLYRLQH